MAEIKITINDAEIVDMVTKMVARDMASQYTSESRDTKQGIKKGVESAIKDYIYANKDEIIDRCVARASAELVRKALPKMIERMESHGE